MQLQRAEKLSFRRKDIDSPIPEISDEDYRPYRTAFAGPSIKTP